MIKRLRASLNAQSPVVFDRTMMALGRSRSSSMLNGGYIRYATFELLAHEIRTHGVVGACAELGVYKGDFSRVINLGFPDRDLYLFDTFEGFHTTDLATEAARGLDTQLNDFSDTGEAAVRARMPHADRVITRKGLFPGTAVGLEVQFCFASIDADLYAPIRAGLEYFWPRLSIGGYLMVHDYNNAAYPGVREAVLEFCTLATIPFVPIPDGYGSVVIAKSK